MCLQSWPVWARGTRPSPSRMGAATSFIMDRPRSIRAGYQSHRDMFDPYGHIDEISVKTRDFR